MRGSRARLRRRRSLVATVVVALAWSLAAATAGAQEVTAPAGEEPASIDSDAQEEVAPAVSAEPFVIPPHCRKKVDAVFWGGRQWFELAQALAHDSSECAEYYVSLPPQDGDATRLRGEARFEEIRALGPAIHPVAETKFFGPTGWRAWVVGGHPDWRPGRTFYGAGVEARRRMAQRVDVTVGETWAFNELGEDILEDQPGRRAEVLEFLRGLYDGPAGAPAARGIVFNIGPFSDAPDVASYKHDLQAWLRDSEFWTRMDSYVDFFAHETYANPANWGVPGAPRARRAEALNDYLFHFLRLAEAGPAETEAARTFLERTYLPLANAAWPHAGIGHTDLISAEIMAGFVSTQVYALRHYANSHPNGAPQGRIGFAWAPNPDNPAYTEDGRDLVAARLASAIHESSDEGTNSQMGACGPPGLQVWCAGDVAGAAFNDVWSAFPSWD